MLAIVVHHSTLLLGDLGDATRWFAGAFLGVDVFFVLSGFLITALLLQEHDRSGRVHLLRFYGRRALRLLPALYVLLIVHVLYVYLTGLPREPEVEQVLGAAFYYKNWLGVFQLDPRLFFGPVHGAPALVHLWSLSVEEQFYLIWPFVVIAALSVAHRTSTALLTLVGFLLAIWAYRWYVFERGDVVIAIYPRTDMRADALIAGALLAVLWLRVGLPARHLKAVGGAAVLVVGLYLAFARLDSPFLWTGGLTVFAFAVAIALHAVLSSGWAANRLLCWRPLVAVGVVSYGVYLWHLPAFDVVARYGGDWPVAVRVAMGVALTAALVTASWYAVERPFLRMKARLEPAGVVSTGPVDAAEGDARPAR